VAALATETAAARLAGRRPSRIRALAVAGVAAVAAGTLVYKLLRSGGDADGA
jgi:hypothetical protein